MVDCLGGEDLEPEREEGARGFPGEQSQVASGNFTAKAGMPKPYHVEEVANDDDEKEEEDEDEEEGRGSSRKHPASKRTVLIAPKKRSASIHADKSPLQDDLKLWRSSRPKSNQQHCKTHRWRSSRLK